MACETERANVIRQQKLVDDIIKEIVATDQKMASLLNTLKKEVPILNSLNHTLQTCLGG